jgi:hypothetical protein
MACRQGKKGGTQQSNEVVQTKKEAGQKPAS